MAPERISSTTPASASAALAALYRHRFGVDPDLILPLKADGSNRQIFRLSGAHGSAVGVFGPHPDENRAFLSYTRAFRSIGLSVPEILADDPDSGVYIEQDLGDVTLLRALDDARSGSVVPESIVALYRQALTDLVTFQLDGARVVDFSLGYPTSEFGAREILWDLNYFKYDFLKVVDIPFSEVRLEEDFARLTEQLLSVPREYFVYRDFQPRNIMIHDGRPWYIDYQGGRRGALQYDVASLLYSSRADLDEPLRAQLLEHYLESLRQRMPVDVERFVRDFDAYRLLRLLQLFGAYGFRGLIERRQHFIDSIPFAVRNVATLLESGGVPGNLPELRLVLERVVATLGERTEGTAAHARGLTVRISSFSYRQGYPVDDTGHGGGFVFDCRALHNPGRYDEYRGLCGLDEPVRAFLAAEDSVGTFVESVQQLVGPAIETYRRRGFEHLSVAFGCTGGQHRSVYAAETLAAWIRERYPDVRVEVLHCERERWPQASRSGGTPWTH